MNLYTLASILHRPVAELLHTMSTAEYYGWLAYLELSSEK